MKPLSGEGALGGRQLSTLEEGFGDVGVEVDEAAATIYRGREAGGGHGQGGQVRQGGTQEGELKVIL